MPITNLWRLVESLEKLDEAVNDALKSNKLDRIAAFPMSTVIAEGRFGKFDVCVALCRKGNRVSLSVAYYDLDDDRAPALWFEDGEIPEFLSDLHDAQRALADYTEQ